MERKFTDIEKIRREKLEKLEALGHQPYARNITFSDNSKSLIDKYESFTKEELTAKEIIASAVFRIMTIRGPFLIGKDSEGNMQSYIGKDFPKEVLALKNLLDLGDIVRVEGKVMKTGTGVLTIRGEKLTLVTKSLRQLPEKFHGLKDVEARYRRRYVDLIVNDDTKKVFWIRTKIISKIRSFMDNLGYMEVDTPILSPILGGAAAEPFTTHHNALDMPFYLRIATELPLKRLLVGGIDRVYEIGRLFRNEGVDTTHNPEFTTIEFYEAYSNLNGIMERTEQVFNNVAKMLGKEEVEINGNMVSFKAPFARINMIDKVSELTGKDMRSINLEEAKELALQHHIELKPFYKVGHIVAELFDELYESQIIQPTFVCGYPVEISPLAALDKEDPRYTERAELFISGKEYANMFTELNDPIDQLSRFESQLEESKKGNTEANEIDIDFVEALEYGMPPAGGCGIGIDRLVMLFTGKQAIREVLLFPHLKNKKEENL